MGWKVLYGSISEALMAKVMKLDDSDCWLWCGTFSGNGYGALKYDGIQHIAHRAMYKSIHGDLPRNIYVCHTCDNRWCVNPDHLFAGTPADNMRDKVEKGRQSKGDKHADSFKSSKKFRDSIRRGEKHAMSKLTDAQRREILDLIDDGMTQSAIASRYNVSQTAIFHINRSFRASI